MDGYLPADFLVCMVTCYFYQTLFITLIYLITYLDLNLLSWSANNMLAVALGSTVFLWNASNGSIQELVQLEDAGDYVCSVSWIKEGNILAVGNSTGAVQV